MQIKNGILFAFIGFLFLSSCSNNVNYKQDLLSGNRDKNITACFELGEKKDTSVVKNLLNKALDPRITHNIKYKGVSVNYAKLMELQKISGYQYRRKITQFQVDTIATLFFIDWALNKEFIKNRNEVDIYYLKK
jgi:hypothetical protein